MEKPEEKGLPVYNRQTKTVKKAGAQRKKRIKEAESVMDLEKEIEQMDLVDDAEQYQKQQTKRRKDWEANHILIKTAYLDVMKLKRRAPTIGEVAERTGHSWDTIQNHLQEVDISHIKERVSMLTEEVIVGMARSAMKGNSGAARIFMEIVHDLSQKHDHKFDSPVPFMKVTTDDLKEMGLDDLAKICKT